MNKKTAQEQVTKYLAANPGSTKEAIVEATGVKGLALFNLLKKMVSTNELAVDGAGDNVTYSLSKKAQGKAEKTQDAEEEDLDLGKSTSRDNSKYKFEGQEYGKGQLVRAVVTKHVMDNLKITYKGLKEVFPDTLLKRFGIFQDVDTARKLSDARDRFFLKDEQVIKLKDKSIAVCSQFTADNIQPFLKAAKELGYKIK